MSLAEQLPNPVVPAWLRNGQVHTVVGGLLPRTLLVRRRAAGFVAQSHFTELNAGDARLTGFYTPGSKDVLVVLIHGWEGSAQSAYQLSAADAIHRTGASVLRLQLRDHGDSHSLNEGPFLGSEHAEVLAAVADAQQRFPAARTCVVGYSLGGNFAVRLAAFAPQAGVSLTAALAVCPPIRPLEAAHAISNSPLYNRYFSMRWKRSIRTKLAIFPGWRPHRWLLDINDIIAMHEAFVPLFTRFADATAYFESYALDTRNIRALSCPTELLLAADDPVCPTASARSLARLEGLSCTLVPHGGHCAFIDSLRMTTWIDHYLCEWLERHT